MEKYIHRRKFQVRYNDCDFRNHLKISAVLSLFQEVAASSAEELGFGYKALTPKKQGFILTNIFCRFSKEISVEEAVEVQTWPLPPDRFRFGREYRICNAEGEELIAASGRWCLLDWQKGSVLPSETLTDQDFSTYNSDRITNFSEWRTPKEAIAGECAYKIVPGIGDCDFNRHVNNTKYADYCMNCFDFAELDEYSIESIYLSYVKQCYPGDLLELWKVDKGNGVYVIQGVKNGAEVAFTAKIQLKKR